MLSTTAAVLRDRSEVDRLRAAIARERQLFEPRRVDRVLDWRQVDAGEPFDWEATLPLTSAKRFFFPARETLLRWRGETIEETTPAVAPFALFGLRPCDLAAITHQDRFFENDPFYARRRAQALLVGVSCRAACAGGFCRDVGAGPFARGGFDLSLTPLPDGRVIVEAGSAEGDALLARVPLASCPLDVTTHAARDEAEAAAVATFPERPFIARAIVRVSRGAVTDAEWQALGPSCLACTGCTSLCPTCSCFTIVDEASAEGGERVRYWDSCLLEGFQREASGHHPAPRPGDRVRRFWYHKLADDFTAEFGRPGCVGCGRCDVACPGTIGALRVLERLGAP